MKESIYEYIVPIKTYDGEVVGYQVKKDRSYFSCRYKKRVDVEVGSIFDGATYAKDINSFSWLIHDVLKRDEKWSDGSKCSNAQASAVLYDILKSEGRWFRARTWYLSTLLWGTFVK